jgi:hypothetical protein
MDYDKITAAADAYAAKTLYEKSGAKSGFIDGALWYQKACTAKKDEIINILLAARANIIRQENRAAGEVFDTVIDQIIKI